MAIKTKRMSDWLAQNGEVITAASKASMLKAVNDEVAQLQDGVFIMTHRWKTYTDNFPLAIEPRKWVSNYQNAGEIADGVLLVEGGHHLVIAPTETQLPWAGGNSDTGAYRTGDRLAAMQDWAGKDNTAKIIAASKDGAITNTEAYAAGFCNKYSRVNGNGKGLTAGRWWLPSVAELMMIYANKAKINHALSLIDGAQQLSENWYWASTEGSSSGAWLLYLNDGYLNFWDAESSSGKVRPVSAFLQ